jgi:hypothetical protein
MAEKIKAMATDIANEDLQRVKKYSDDAVRSGAYLYPFKGIAYFVSHRALWKPLLSRLTPTLTIGIGVTTFMFAVTYVPQAAVMALFNGPLAVISAVALVLSESSTITNLIARAFFINEALVDTFDATLISRGATDVLSEGREIHDAGGDPVARLGRLVKTPFAGFSPKAILRYLLYMPLNAIPVVGTVIFLFLQGRKAGPAAHARYFQLKGFNPKQRDEFVDRRQAAYTSFGVPAVVLELIPFVGIFFAFTNTCGAALWAANLENERMTAPNLRQQADSASKTD